MLKAFAIVITISLGVASLNVAASSTSSSDGMSMFTYQGHLKQSGQPVTDEVTFIFRLFDSAEGGKQVGDTIVEFDWPIEDGLFTVPLDFGAGVFDGSPLWLDIRVNGDQLAPRQTITPAPYAIRALYNGDGNGNEFAYPIGPAGGDLAGEYPEPVIAADAVYSNQLAADAASLDKVSNGVLRIIDDDVSANIVGGHSANQVHGNSRGATIGGGGTSSSPNHIENANYAVINGGRGNIASGIYSVIGGGVDNVAVAAASTVAGGDENSATSFHSTVGGGILNVASGPESTVIGGGDNVASAWHATVAGGFLNQASGQISFAAGKEARAEHDGAFVWADMASGQVHSSAANEWTAACSGGVRFFTSSNLSSGVQVGPGGNSWSSISDRNAKENFEPVDTIKVLEHLAAIPMATWNYKSEDPTIRRMGPMAQDFWPAFGLGDDEMRISTVDADGVAFAAIQGLYDLLQERDDVIEAQRNKIGDLRDRLETLEALMHSLTNDSEGDDR